MAKNVIEPDPRIQMKDNQKKRKWGQHTSFLLLCTPATSQMPFLNDTLSCLWPGFATEPKNRNKITDISNTF